MQTSDFKPFQEIGPVIGIDDALAELQGLSDPYADGEWRADMHFSPHVDSKTLVLIGPPSPSPRDILHSLVLEPSVRDDIPNINRLLHNAHGVIKALCPEAALARAMVVSLKPGGVVTPHIDIGHYAEATDRFHVPMQTNRMATLEIDGITGGLEVGSVYFVQKHQRHSAYNYGAEPRIHLIFDVFRSVSNQGDAA